QIVTHSRGNIGHGAMIKIGPGTLISKNVLQMVRTKRAAVLPLRVTSAIAFANSQPAMPADGLPRSHISLFEPRNHQRRFRLELAMRDIVVRECTVKGILARYECDRDVTAPR